MQQELEALKAVVEAQGQNAVGHASSSTPTSTVAKQIYVASGRRLECFRGKPERASDPSVQEWARDVRGQLTARQLEEDNGAAFFIDHLAGRARQEILGRGDVVKGKPEEILRILLKVFGDGDTLPQIQQKFFSYQQSQTEDLLSCSLELVELFNSMTRLDNSFEAVREKTLKGRLAEAVRDEGLRRELRRLNIDSPSLSFFEARDRAIEWLGNSQVKQQREATVHEVKASEGTGGLKSLLEEQGKKLERQQQQIDAIVKLMTDLQPVRHWDQGQRRCYNCQSTEHLKRDCPLRPPAGRHRPPSSGQRQHMRSLAAQQPLAQQFVAQQPQMPQINPPQLQMPQINPPHLQMPQINPQQPAAQMFGPQRSATQQFSPQQLN